MNTTTVENMIKIKSVKELFSPNLPFFINTGYKKLNRNVLYFIDLSEFHIFEQLLIEESLYRMAPILTEGRNDVGFLLVNDTSQMEKMEKMKTRKQIDEYTPPHLKKNKNKSVIFGLAGKVNDFIIDKNYIKQNNICLIKRFTGGGTVYINSNCLLVSLILPHRFTHISKKYKTSSNNVSSSVTTNTSTNVSNTGNVIYSTSENLVYKLGPSNITDWSFHFFYGKFMKQKKNLLFTSNFCALENDYASKTYDKSENKYIIKKIGGNAQAFSKHYFVHHSSFIWFCNFKEIHNVLVNPKKQPKYRSNRSHEDFIDSIQTCLNPNIKTPHMFIKNLIYHTKQILTEMNDQTKSTEGRETWLFKYITLNTHNDKCEHLGVDSYVIDVQTLKELFSLFNNNVFTKHLRATRFIDIEGNRVSDHYYPISHILLDPA